MSFFGNEESVLVGPVENRAPYSEKEMAVMPDDLSCVSCGRPVPNFHDHGNTFLVVGEQLCPECGYDRHGIGYSSLGDSSGRTLYE